MRLGKLQKRAGVSPRLIRYYEAQELLRAERSSTGQRVVDQSHVEFIGTIRWLLDAGLSTRVIRELMDCVRAPDSIEPCAVPTLFDHLDDFDERIARLSGTRATLQVLIDSAGRQR
ncbi:DNA-binding transcriptional MerR regulator [Brevibacterium epidermidis]|jgi:DNA-binding transcriptional MerR regulator|uniref:DNA-binding transcriptional MerR regulator n=1 Tax=Brevibacterium epidermidis TaxID=1698 RepID=A0ABV4EPB0_BREEP